MNTYSATEPQKNFITSLVDGREVPTELSARITLMWETMTKRDASELIDALKALPPKRYPKIHFADGEEKPNPLRELLAELPTGKYAVPSYIIEHAVDEFVPHGNLVFFEVKTYMGTPYLRNLVGAFKDFTRVKLSYKDSLGVAKVLTENPVGFIQLFGKNFTCCGKCGSPLTDEKSRALFLGPDCRKMLGL